MKETKRQAVSPGCPRSVFWRTQRVNKRSQPAIIRSGRKACLRVRRRLKAEQCYKMGVSAKVSRGGRNSHPREESAWVCGLVEVLVVAQSDPTHSEWRCGYGKNRAEIGVCVCVCFNFNGRLREVVWDEVRFVVQKGYLDVCWCGRWPGSVLLEADRQVSSKVQVRKWRDPEAWSEKVVMKTEVKWIPELFALSGLLWGVKRGYKWVSGG